jgi:hypothetical protein
VGSTACDDLGDRSALRVAKQLRQLGIGIMVAWQRDSGDATAATGPDTAVLSPVQRRSIIKGWCDG